jgi:hypothetical protein
MRRLADVHPGNAKTDARGAFVIANAARTLPHTLRRVDTGQETRAELEVLVGFDDNLAGESASMAHFEGVLERLGEHGEMNSHVVLSTQYDGRPIEPPAQQTRPASTPEGWSRH